MAKKKVEKIAQEIRSFAEKDVFVYGERETLKRLKHNNIKKIFIALNCKKDILEDIKHYSSLTNTEVVITPYRNSELGVICKKHYAVSVLGVNKA